MLPQLVANLPCFTPKRGICSTDLVTLSGILENAIQLARKVEKSGWDVENKFIPVAIASIGFKSVFDSGHFVEKTPLEIAKVVTNGDIRLALQYCDWYEHKLLKYIDRRKVSVLADVDATDAEMLRIYTSYRKFYQVDDTFNFTDIFCLNECN
jgi:hypothetical protein